MLVIDKIKDGYCNLSENSRIIIANVAGAFLVKGLSLTVSLLATPTYIKFFKDEAVLGVWFTILSVISWILNFDLGIGNGLRNHLTKAYAEKDYHEARELVSSAYIVIGTVSLVIIMLSSVIFGFVDWNEFFKIDKSIVSPQAMLSAVKLVFIGIVLQIFLKIVSSVLYAIQKSSVNNVISLVTSVLILVVLSISPSGDNDSNIVFMAIVYDVAILFPYVVASFVIFCGKKYRSIAPKRFLISKRHAVKVLSLGGYFFFVQILYMLIMGVNEYIISYLTGSSDVVEYRIYFQLFTLGGTVFSLALTPVWSAITKAITEKNIVWVKRLYRKLVLGGLFGMSAEFLMIPLLQTAFSLWLGETVIQADYQNAVAFAILGGLMIFNSIFSSVANGAGKLGTQLAVFLFGAVLKVPLSVLLVGSTGSWIGVVWATDVAILVYCIVQPITLHRFIQNEIK